MKLQEMFVESINKAYTSADVMTDVNQKPMAYASIAQAIATYLAGNGATTAVTTTVETIKEEKVEPKAEPKAKTEVKAESKKTEAKKWAPDVDEDGIPVISDEDKKDPQKLVAYRKLMATPEVKAKMKARDEAKAKEIMNEDKPSAKSAPKVSTKAKAKTTAPTKKEEKTGPSEEVLTQLETFKEAFGYEEDTTTLDNLVHNCTDAKYSALADLSEDLIEPFVLFVHKEVSNAWDKVNGYKEDENIGVEKLDAYMATAYDEESATIEEYLHDGNVIWFANEVVDLMIAQEWLESYKESWGDLDEYVQAYTEDGKATIDDINEENVIGFVEYLNSLVEEE